MNRLLKHHPSLKKYSHAMHGDEENTEIVMSHVHPLAVNEYSCILGKSVSNRRYQSE